MYRSATNQPFALHALVTRGTEACMPVASVTCFHTILLQRICGVYHHRCGSDICHCYLTHGYLDDFFWATESLLNFKNTTTAKASRKLLASGSCMQVDTDRLINALQIGMPYEQQVGWMWLRTS